MENWSVTFSSSMEKFRTEVVFFLFFWKIQNRTWTILSLVSFISERKFNFSSFFGKLSEMRGKLSLFYVRIQNRIWAFSPAKLFFFVGKIQNWSATFFSSMEKFSIELFSLSYPFSSLEKFTTEVEVFSVLSKNSKMKHEFFLFYGKT